MHNTLKKIIGRLKKSKKMDRLYPKRSSGRYFILNELRESFVKIIEKYLEDNLKYKLLDYGCGDIPYKSLFKKNVEYVAYDFITNPKATKYLNNLNTTEEESSSYDIVLSSQVLEHVDSPDLYFNEISRVLKGKGLLFLSTHGTWMYHPSPKDFWRWTSDGLIKLLNDHGFSVLEILSIGDLTTSGLQLFQDGIRNKIPRIFRKPFFFIMQSLQYFLYKNKYNNDACVYLIISKKRENEHK
jgi:SAM-dependent methyltransferase